MAEAGGAAAAAPPDIDPDFEPQSRPRSCTWPLPRPELPAGAAEAGGAGAAAEEGSGGAAAAGPGRTEGARAGGGGGGAAAARKGGSRRNAWGNQSYAELISQAIESAPEKRLTLAQIYEWMVRSVPYFKDKGDSNSSAGWKVRGARGCGAASRCSFFSLLLFAPSFRSPRLAVYGRVHLLLLIQFCASIAARCCASLCSLLVFSGLCWKEQSCRRGCRGAAETSAEGFF